MIVNLYKLRWQIEYVFKKYFLLKYFLGDNEDYIKIQIYSNLIVDLFIYMIKKNLHEVWAFSKSVNFYNIHLFS